MSAFLLLATLALASQNSADAWEMIPASAGEGPRLHYAPAGGMHGEVFARCHPSSGWVFMSVGAIGGSGLETPSAGVVIITAPTRYGDDPHFEGDYAQMVLPANSLLVRALGDGEALRIGGQRYPVRTEEERRRIRNFVRACDAPEDVET